MTPRDEQRLSGVHPDLVDAYRRIDAAMRAFGAAIFVVQGVRSTAEQQALYAKGRTAPGRIVTYLDGELKRSKHQTQADGVGHALDVAFVNDPRTPKDETFDLTMPWAVVGTMGEHLGLVWGGRWQLVDLGHLEIK